MYFFFDELKKLKKSKNNHYEFLLKVKHDIPLLNQKIIELEDQILPPEEHEIH